MHAPKLLNVLFYNSFEPKNIVQNETSPFLYILIIKHDDLFTKTKFTVEIEIESGKTTKIFNEGKLESFRVEMFALHYGNVIVFQKQNDLISIKSGDEPDVEIKIYVKNQFPVRELLFKNKLIATIETIHFDLNHLPKDKNIISYLKKDKTQTYCNQTNYEEVEDEDLDKSIKLFSGLDYEIDLITIDAIFEALADFFSQDDALLRIYSGRYAETITPRPLLTNYLKTDTSGKIKSGVIWTAKNDKTGKYEIYKNGQLIKTGTNSLVDFQVTFMEYINEMEE